MKMPTRARQCLALRFRQNWMAKHPVDIPCPGGGALDDSLTSLNWLQNLNIMKTLNPTPPASPEPDTGVMDFFHPNSNNDNIGRVNPNAVLNMSNQVHIKKEKSTDCGYGSTHSGNMVSHRSHPYSLGGIEVAPPMVTSFNGHLHDKIDYKTNSSVKPPYSYATLICMAMKESKKNKITLAGIYNWITENFMYYRMAEPSWQNSIRHNLSLNKCFQKVARRKDEPGKGGFWRINPEYSDMFVNGIFKKRRQAGGREPAIPLLPPTKKIKIEPREAEEDYMAAMALSNEMNSSDNENAREQSQIHGVMSDHREIIKSDFNWNAIFNQDISVSGVKIKTEDLIDGEIDSSCDSGPDLLDEGVASPITALSPPPSESNSDTALEDFLSQGDFGADTLDGPLDLSTGGELDLTITGSSIRPPNWWAESISGGHKGFMSPDHVNSGLNTPLVPASPVHESELGAPHPWAENRTGNCDLDEAIASFDLDLQNLFEDDTLGSTTSFGDS